MALPLLGAAEPGDPRAPTLQEVEAAGRVLHFQVTQPVGRTSMAVVYNAGDPQSLREASALVALFGRGVSGGEMTLQPVLVEQAHLGTAAYDAVFATVGVDAALLGAAIRQMHVPCLTRHVEQVSHGACIVAISSSPRIGILLSTANAAAAGVRFATAFRMMVDE